MAWRAWQNLAARAQAVADCEAATIGGRFALNGVTPYVGPFAPTVLATQALDLAKNGGERVARPLPALRGRPRRDGPRSGYSTALDAWQTFEAQGVAHPVTSGDGVAPPVGAWLYYRDSTNPAGHVVTYLGNGQIASTDVFAIGRVGVGPASAITDGPWHMQYLGWAAALGERHEHPTLATAPWSSPCSVPWRAVPRRAVTGGATARAIHHRARRPAPPRRC